MSGIELCGLRRSYTLKSRSLTDFRAREILLADFDEEEPEEGQKEARRKRSRKGRLKGGLGGPG